MKRLSLISLILVLLGSLAAQTQTLPDMKISGESGVKAYLYKRGLLFSPLDAFGDSLPAFVPRGAKPAPTRQLVPVMKHRSYLQLEGNTDFGLNSFISYYPKDLPLQSVSHFMELRAPESDLSSLRNNLFLGGELSPTLPLAFRLDQASATADSFSTANLDVSLAHYRLKQDFGSLTLHDLSLQLTYNYLNQELKGLSFRRDYYDLYYAGRVKSNWLDAKTKLLSQAGEAGLQIAPLLNWEPLGFSQVRTHILADAYSFIPSVEFCYRKPLTSGGLFTLANEPLLESNRFSRLLEKSPWIQFSDAHKLQKTPLNLKADLELIHPLSQDFSLTRLNLSCAMRYDHHSPILGSSLQPDVAALYFTDVAAVTSKVESFFRLGVLALHQGLKIDLAYLPRDSYYRAPYRPAFSLNTHLNYPYLNWRFGCDLVQDYFAKDHTGRNLPEAVVLNLGAEYLKGDSALYCQAANLFNRKQWIYSQQPASGRTLFLGLKHRF